MSYRTALWGWLGAVGFATLWCSVARASWGIASLSWLVLFVIAVALTRSVSEGGLLFVQAFRPSDLLIALVGTRPFNERHLTVMAFVEKVFMFDLRTFLLPFFMDSFRIAQAMQLPLRPLAKAMPLSVLASLTTSSWSFLRLVYREGANTMMQGWVVFTTLPPAGSGVHRHLHRATPPTDPLEPQLFFSSAFLSPCCFIAFGENASGFLCIPSATRWDRVGR